MVSKERFNSLLNFVSIQATGKVLEENLGQRNEPNSVADLDGETFSDRLSVFKVSRTLKQKAIWVVTVQVRGYEHFAMAVFASDVGVEDVTLSQKS